MIAFPGIARSERVGMALGYIAMSLGPLLLSACAPGGGQQAAAGAGGNAAMSSLERAALETGVISNASTVSPVGLFATQHEAGRDQLCLVPEKDKHFRFGVEVVFGTEQYCRGKGTARQAGDKLIMNFSDRSKCLVVAQYDGDRISLPGALDVKCDDLCTGRGSLEGVSLGRITNDATSAMKATDRSRNAMCR